MGKTETLKIGIVGGSLSGCIAAILLARAGHDVEIFERSKRGLLGRGGGLTTSRTVFEQLKACDIIDKDFPGSPFDTLKMRKWSADNPYVGHCGLERPLDMVCVNWGGLWENMRSHIPDEIYHSDKELIGANELESGIVELEFQCGDHKSVDLVLFADGYRSIGRKLLFPEIDLTNRGYMVWRGVLPESEIKDFRPLDEHPRYSYRNIDGSFISFVIPNHEGSMKPGERIINWAAYIPLPENELAAFMIDNQGNRRSGTIPSGAMRTEQDAELKALMQEQLPSFYADILEKSEGNQIQQIYTCEVPAYRKGRMCLIGDAGMVVQPMTGSGVFKGFSNAKDLADYIAEKDDLETALATWSTRQTSVARSMLSLGLQMEEAFIWKTIDLAKASPEECDEWWKNSINTPEEFSYFAN